jgi:hypothetical protein
MSQISRALIIRPYSQILTIFWVGAQVKQTNIQTTSIWCTICIVVLCLENIITWRNMQYMWGCQKYMINFKNVLHKLLYIRIKCLIHLYTYLHIQKSKVFQMGTSHGLELFWEHMVSVFHMVDSHPNLFLYHQVRLQNETDCTESGNISLTRLWKRIEKSVWIGTPKPLMYRRRSCYVGISRFETTLGILRMIMWQVYTQHWDLWSQWASPPVLSMLLWIIKLNV